MNIDIEWPEHIRRKIWAAREDILINGECTIQFTPEEEELMATLLSQAVKKYSTDARHQMADTSSDSA